MEHRTKRDVKMSTIVHRDALFLFPIREAAPPDAKLNGHRVCYRTRPQRRELNLLSQRMRLKGCEYNEAVIVEEEESLGRSHRDISKSLQRDTPKNTALPQEPPPPNFLK